VERHRTPKDADPRNSVLMEPARIRILMEASAFLSTDYKPGMASNAVLVDWL
jgi:hypothetical protein